MFKKAFKATYVSSPHELGSVVEASSSARFNKAQLVVTHDGKVIVPVYDWSAFLDQYFKKDSQHYEISSFTFFNQRTWGCLLQEVCSF